MTNSTWRPILYIVCSRRFSIQSELYHRLHLLCACGLGSLVSYARPRNGIQRSSRSGCTSKVVRYFEEKSNGYHQLIQSHRVKPKHYEILISNPEFGGEWSYTGTVIVEVAITEPVKKITLNSKNITVVGASIRNGADANEATISYDDPAERVTFEFRTEVPASDSSKLEVSFKGIMNSSMAGFYRSKYKPVTSPPSWVPNDGKFHYMFSTQFESCDARQAFPCFDEPNLKATFALSLDMPKEFTALSNMPIMDEGTVESKPEYKRVTFETTPIMSTYLLAWAYGDLAYVEGHTERQYNGRPLPVRVYATNGLENQGQYALEHACKTIDYFSEIFKIDYPLPKSDLLAVHEFSHGAMENWGLVTYRTTAVLFDEKTSDEKYKNRVAYVVAHELAHQWFGNLVTMDWWSELWLNESFATWVGWLGVHHIHPDWNVWNQFVSEYCGAAFQLDSLRSSHPIEVPVRNSLEIEQIFDQISYQKGSSCLRMLAEFIGVEPFLAGVATYLKAHAYGNATTLDLYKHLSAASGKDVAGFMDNWTGKIGFPVVTVAEEPGQIRIQQSRFLSTGDVKAGEDDTIWTIPLSLITLDSRGILKSVPTVLSTKEMTVRDVPETFYKLNLNSTSFYRTNYPPARLLQLGEQRHRLSAQDKIGLIGDAAALAVAGKATTPALLAFTEKFADETEYLVWSQLIGSVANVISIFSTEPSVRAPLQAFIIKLISPAISRLDTTPRDGESYSNSQLRSLLFLTGCTMGHQALTKRALAMADAYFVTNDKVAIDPSLRLAVYRTYIEHGGKPAYEHVEHEYATGTSIDGKEICLAALGRTRDPALIERYIAMIFSSQIAYQDKHTAAASLAANPEGRQALWPFVRDHWEQVRESLGPNMVVVARFLKVALGKFVDHETEREIAAFFEGRDNQGYDRSLAIVADTIRGNADYRERDQGVVGEWLAAHHYT